MRQRLRSKGQALVEFALMATLIFFLLAATVDLGLIFFTLQGLHNAAQEGASYGSRWLLTTNGVGGLDYGEIRRRVRFEAGNRGSGFANLIDLNSNGVDDMTDDGANIGVATGSSLFPTFIQIRGLLDANGSGDPTDDGAAPEYTPCPNVADRTIRCFLKVDVFSDYKVLFPFASAVGAQRRLQSSYIMPMRSGQSQNGAPANTPVISTITPSPTNTPLPTPTIQMCTVPNFNGVTISGNTAQNSWTNAGFTGSFTKHDHSSGSTIRSQSLAAGSSQPCSSSITVHDH
jgi:hypothetical protein